MISKLAFLLGVVGVPLVLLVLGHDFRRRSGRARTLFWGATSGFLAGMLISAVLAVLPATDWAGGPAWRTLAVHWGGLAGAVLGASFVLATWSGGHDHQEQQPRHRPAAR
jgi:hypothetical protein